MITFDVKFMDNKSSVSFDSTKVAEMIFHQMENHPSPLSLIKENVKEWSKVMSGSENNRMLSHLYRLVCENGRYDTVERYLRLNYGFGKPSRRVGKKLEFVDVVPKVPKDDVAERMTLDTISDYCLKRCHVYESELKPIYDMLVSLMGDSQDAKWLETKMKIERRISELTGRATVIQHADEVVMEKNVNKEYHGTRG